MMTKLRKEYEKEKKIVTITTLWKVVKKSQVVKNQMAKCYNWFNVIYLIREIQNWRGKLSKKEKLNIDKEFNMMKMYTCDIWLISWGCYATCRHTCGAMGLAYVWVSKCKMEVVLANDNHDSHGR